MRYGTARVNNVCALVLIAIILIGGLALGRYFSTGRARIRLEDRLALIQKNDLAFAATTRDKLRKMLKEKAIALDRVKQRVPTTSGMGVLLRDFHGIAEKRGIQLENLNYLAEERLKGHRRIPVEIMARGDFHALYGFIHDLETLNRICILETVDIHRFNNEKRLRAAIKASVFYQ
ncbi:MAG: type 4a pilus biogenesis protein PilO [Desulfobacterium sp.]|nr:type 4a pilus biogenesis protein PilO [Desulfobacterium sp.]